MNHLWWVRSKIKLEIVLQLSISYAMFARLCTPPTRPHPNSCPCAATNFKRVLVGWEEKLMQILGCHCGFILLAYAQASLAERLLVQLGLSSLNWLSDPPPL